MLVCACVIGVAFMPFGRSHDGHACTQYARNTLLFNVSFVLPIHADTVSALL